MASQLGGDGDSGVWVSTASGGRWIAFSDQRGGGDLCAYIAGNDRGGSGTGDNSLVFGVVSSGGGRYNQFINGDESTAASSGAHEKMVLGQFGDLGIGVQTPTRKLDVNGTARVRGDLTVDEGFAVGSNIGSSSTEFCYFPRRADCNTLNGYSSSSPTATGSILSTDSSIFLMESDGDAIRGWFDCNNSDFFWGGNVSLGGSEAIDSSYTVHVDGSIYSSGSSLKYKENITDYKQDSDKFGQLRPVTYNYKEEYKKKGKPNLAEKQIGLIAEEVAEVYPELALTLEEGGNPTVRNVDYEKLTVILLSEVQKLRQELDNLKQDISNHGN